MLTQHTVCCPYREVQRKQKLKCREAGITSHRIDQTTGIQRFLPVSLWLKLLSLVHCFSHVGCCAKEQFMIPFPCISGYLHDGPESASLLSYQTVS